MTFTALHLVTKLNKGTSRTEYGELNHWGYKAANGIIRSRVVPPSVAGEQGTIVVKYYDISALKNTWRKRLDWDSAFTICTSFIKVDDIDKGPDAKSMITEVNALIEVYNDEVAKHVGRKVVRTEDCKSRDSYNTHDDRLNPYEVTGVELSFDIDMVLTTTLVMQKLSYGSGSRFSANDVEDYATDTGKAAVKEQIEEYRRRIAVSTNFLNRLEEEVEAGHKVVMPGYIDKKELGLLDIGGMDILGKAINELVVDSANLVDATA